MASRPNSLKWANSHSPSQCFHNILVNVWVTGEVPQQWTYSTIKACHKKKHRTDCNNYRRISHLAHAGIASFKIVVCHHGSYHETEELLPKEQCDFRPARSTVDILFVVRRLQELRRQRKTPLYG